MVTLETLEILGVSMKASFFVSLKTFPIINCQWFPKYFPMSNLLSIPISFFLLNRKRQQYLLLSYTLSISLFSRLAPIIKPACRCQIEPPPPMVPGAWEGAAVLAHGSLLRFGCLTFVFSVPSTDLLHARNAASAGVSSTATVTATATATAK